MHNEIKSQRAAATAVSSLGGLLPTLAPWLFRSLRRHPITTILGVAAGVWLVRSVGRRQPPALQASLVERFDQ
jgi:hypothetical protein